MVYFLIFISAIFVNNIVLSQFLGICPFLGVSKKINTALGMGAAVLFVMTLATLVNYLLQQLLMQAFLPAIYEVLGLFIPLIVVNCIVLGRAEAFAAKNTVGLSALDGLGMGLGFTLSLTVIGAVRELLGTGCVFGMNLYSEAYGMLIFVLAPGAFIVLGYLMALVQKLLKK